MLESEAEIIPDQPPRVAANTVQAETLSINETNSKTESIAAFVVMFISGLVMFALSLYAWMKNPADLLGAWGPIATLVGLMMGGMIILGSVYYIMKSSFSGR